MIQTTTHCTAPRCAADPNRHKEQPKLSLGTLANCPARYCVCLPLVFRLCLCLDGHTQAPQPHQISVGNKVVKLRTGDNPRLVMNLLQQKEENQGKP